MFLKRTIRRNGTDSYTTYRESIRIALTEMLNEIGIVGTEIKTNGLSWGSNYIPGLPNTCGKISQYRLATYGGNISNSCNFKDGLFFKVDGVNYALDIWEGEASILNEFTELAQADYYNSKEGSNSNFLGAKASIYKNPGLLGNDTRFFITIYRNLDSKTFGIILKSDSYDSYICACHTGVTNYGPISNDGFVCLPYSYGTISSRKDYGVSEEVFRIINPISFYGSEAFDYVDNIDKITNKAYIQKPLIAMYKRGIVGEMKGLYFSTIKAPAIGDLVSMGGITYIYIGNGMYFKNEV